MTEPVRDACDACFEQNKNDCSAFVRAVSSRLGVPMKGLADEIVDALRDKNGPWTPIEDGPAAAAAAGEAKLVVAGLRGDEQARPDIHGHVVIVVPGPLNRGRYPSAYWGSLAGHPGKDETINFAWRPEDRDRVTYAFQDLPARAHVP